MQYSFLMMVTLYLVTMSLQAKEEINLAQNDEWARNFMLANLEFTLLHEFGHAFIEEFKPPVLGMEEDAADRFAIIAMMKAREYESAEKTIPWLFSVAGGWYTEWELKEEVKGKIDYWDNHNLEIQRFHNIVCLIFGSNADVLEDLMDTEFLPFERAMTCDYEYKQALHAVNWLQNNYSQKSDKALNTQSVTVVYEQPREGQNKMVFELLQNFPVAETWAQRLSRRFTFLRPIRIEFENCSSVFSAYWHAPTASVTVCYELLVHFMQMAEYRRQHSSRACGIPVLRKYMGDSLNCH